MRGAQVAGVSSYFHIAHPPHCLLLDSLGSWEINQELLLYDTDGSDGGARGWGFLRVRSTGHVHSRALEARL